MDSVRAQSVSEPTDGESTTVVTERFSVDDIYRRINEPLVLDVGNVVLTDTVTLADMGGFVPDKHQRAQGIVPSIYSMPYSMTGRAHDWRRLWINTGVLTGAFVGTLLVLECLPEDATTWNRAELQMVPLFTRYRRHVFEKGPEWDHDKFIFNYVLHPYAGAVYFMSARSVGFNFWQSMLYCTLISNVGWEFGIEAFMERPSYQDLIITPFVGSAIGECFYKTKRYLVEHDYHLFGSSVLGNIVAFFIDPVNEVVGLFDGNPARAVSRRLKAERGENMAFVPMLTPRFKGFTLAVTF